MGTQQLIPKGLASGIRQSKAADSGPPGQGLTGLLGLDSSKRALKTLSMVETGAYFSTEGGRSEGTEGESESPGTLRRGLRSTSYRRAVVSGVDLEVPSTDPKTSLSLPVIKGIDKDPVNPSAGTGTSCTDNPTSPGDPKPTSSGSTAPISPGTTKPTSPGAQNPPSTAKPKVSKPASFIIEICVNKDAQ